MTRAEVLHHALAFALRKVHLGPKRLKLDEETLWQIAGEAIDELRKFGGLNELDEEVPMRPAPATRGQQTRPRRPLAQTNVQRDSLSQDHTCTIESDEGHTSRDKNRKD